MTAIEKRSVIGGRFPKPDAPDKAVGRTRYINDLELPRMLFGKILHTDRPHAKIVRIDTSKAEALPGVHVVLTGEDFPDLTFGINRDNVPLKKGKVRCIRDEVAAVAADTEEICDAALALIEVEYEDLPGVFDPIQAMEEGAPLIHDDRPGNLSLAYKFDHGNVTEAEAASDVIMDHVFNVHYVTHCCMGTSSPCIVRLQTSTAS